MAREARRKWQKQHSLCSFATLTFRLHRGGSHCCKTATKWCKRPVRAQRRRARNSYQTTPKGMPKTVCLRLSSTLTKSFAANQTGQTSKGGGRGGDCSFIFHSNSSPLVGYAVRVAGVFGV
ncbi:hypothetical protein M407DRAFT_160886 [Tulasnella calospora MUT 4182]|uniref:Uncharacterized protein n=1 Tax=Tulasnella calospora MUT 4182 TaxID=1051891 RepID=A0A0C3QQM3_9AGAM|nr:hypothetical protein M407DRAFT_160886 [Tulasnella calospora MUT 4182]